MHVYLFPSKKKKNIYIYNTLINKNTKKKIRKLYSPRISRILFVHHTTTCTIIFPARFLTYRTASRRNQLPINQLEQEQVENDNQKNEERPEDGGQSGQMMTVLVYGQ